jgi:hypothetical protein
MPMRADVSNAQEGRTWFFPYRSMSATQAFPHTLPIVPGYVPTPLSASLFRISFVSDS